MAGNSGGGGFGWFIVGCAVGAAGMYYGPDIYAKRVLNQQPLPKGSVRMEAGPGYVPGQWTRRARIDIAFSRFKATGAYWDWPMTDPELQLCIREGTDFRKCYGPLDLELAPCKARFSCTTAVIPVPSVAFVIELNEWDDYNSPDPIGATPCDVGQTCKFQLGEVTVRDAGAVSNAAPQVQSQ